MFLIICNMFIQSETFDKEYITIITKSLITSRAGGWRFFSL